MHDISGTPTPAPGRVRLLPDHVANQIAAGEVVERPASVVKELVENAIDAGATLIDIESVDGGRKLISVADDGTGMNRDDALLCLERHATSKIQTAEDIESVSTMGFRGEAIPSIASVSRFTLLTRPREQLEGTEIVVSGGKILSVEDRGCAPGTQIEVRNLFFNTPARRKFLKAEQTELAHIRQLILTFAIAHPTISFRLRVDGREIFNLPGGATLHDRIRDLFPDDMLDDLRVVVHAEEDIEVVGLAGGPMAHRGDKRDQYIFVNRRAASAPLIGYAIAQAYQGVLPRERYPILFLFITVPPGEVDVNVHPSKREVRFRRVAKVRDAVFDALRSSLGLGGNHKMASMPDTSKHTDDGLASAGQGTSTTASPPSLPVPMDYPGMPVMVQRDLPVETVLLPSGPAVTPSSPPLKTSSPVAPRSTPSLPPPRAPIAASSPWQQHRVLGSLADTYIVMETEDGMVVLDPQAAHERIVFESLLYEALGKSDATSQLLLRPETVVMTPREADLVRRNIEGLAGLGFGVSEFGRDTFLVDRLPRVMGDVSPARVLGEVAREIEETGGRRAGEGVIREQIARSACRLAVRDVSSLSPEELDALISRLAACEMPYTCPHGRPTMIYTSLNELKRRFGSLR